MPGPTPTPTPFPLALSDFQARFPEFKSTDTTLVSTALNDAALLIDRCVWGVLAGQGHGYLTAHRLALSPFGQQARMVAKDGKSTTYLTHYERLVGIVGSGYRVL
jgi:Protein of unknown function (DUF4054)